MKKKFFAIYALVGAMVASPVFTSCVDDEESASVTALRQAKAEQLKSIATLNNAKAEAETTLANADAALKAAQAAQVQALADKYAAEAKIKELEAQLKADSYDAELAAALAQAQADLAFAEQQIAFYQGEMQKASLTLEKELANLEGQLLEAQKQLADKKDAMAEAEYQELKDLTAVYGQRLVWYTTYSQAILEEEAEIAATEAELADWETVIAGDVAEKEQTIKYAQAQIETLKQYTNYTADIEAMEAEIKDLENALGLADDKYIAANKAYAAISYNDLYSENKIEELREAIFETNMGKLLNWNLPYTYLVNNNDVNPVSVYEFNGFTIEKDDYLYNSLDFSGWNSDSLNVELEYKDVRAFELVIADRIAAQDVEGKKEAIEAEETGLQAVYDAAVKATAEAKKAYDEAAATDKDAKKQAYADALNAEKTAKDNLDAATEALAVAEENVEGLNLIYSLVSDEKAAEDFVAAVKAYNEAIVAIHTEKAEAYFAMMEAYDAKAEAEIALNTLVAVYGSNSAVESEYVEVNMYDLLWGKSSLYEKLGLTWEGWYSGNMDDNVFASTVLRLYINKVVGNNSAQGIDSLIKALEESIESLEEEIEELKDVTSAEQALEVAKIRLENMKQYQVAMKAELDATKAKLDELQAKLVATEETPAE